jgi:hypothetical protein
MGRPIYPYELADADFSWLITNFQENHPEYTLVEDSSLPIVFIGTKEAFVDLVVPVEEEAVEKEV